MNKLLSVAALLTTFVTVPSIAAGGADPSIYFGLDFYSRVTLTNLSAGATQPNSGFGIVGGYYFSPTLAAEVGYANYAGAVTTGSSYTPTTSHVAAVGTYAINDTFSLIGKLGYIRKEVAGPAAFACTTCTNSGLMYGAGAQFNINKQVGFRLQYEAIGAFNMPDTSAPRGSAINLGIIYSF